MQRSTDSDDEKAITKTEKKEKQRQRVGVGKKTGDKKEKNNANEAEGRRGFRDERLYSRPPTGAAPPPTPSHPIAKTFSIAKS